MQVSVVNHRQRRSCDISLQLLAQSGICKNVNVVIQNKYFLNQVLYPLHRSEMGPVQIF